MSYDQELEAARLENLTAREVTRQRVLGMPLAQLVDEVLAGRQRRNNLGREGRAALWGSPPTGSSHTRGEAGRAGPRNVRFT